MSLCIVLYMKCILYTINAVYLVTCINKQTENATNQLTEQPFCRTLFQHFRWRFAKPKEYSDWWCRLNYQHTFRHFIVEFNHIENTLGFNWVSTKSQKFIEVNWNCEIGVRIWMSKRLVCMKSFNIRLCCCCCCCRPQCCSPQLFQ